jgi:hypothetical protein
MKQQGLVNAQTKPPFNSMQLSGMYAGIKLIFA